MKYSIQSILFPSLNSNLDHISVDIFFKGCNPPHCVGCHNSDLKTFCPPNKTELEIIEVLKKYSDVFRVVTFMGGEPLDQDLTSINLLLDALKKEFPDVKISIYTKYDFQQVPKLILSKIDYLKCGRYLEQHKTPFGSFLSTKNQIMYHKVKNSWSPQWSHKT